MLENLNLEMPEGAFEALMGPSGSGKSTLLNLIAGLDRAERRHASRSPAPTSSRMSDGELAKLRSQQHRLHLPDLQPDAGAHGAPRTSSCRCCSRSCRRASARSARRRRCASSASRTAWTTTRASSPAVRSSASRSRAPSSTTRRSSSPTSPPAISIARAPTRSCTLLEKLNKEFKKTILMVTHDPGGRRARDRHAPPRQGALDMNARRHRAQERAAQQVPHRAHDARRRGRDPRVRAAAHRALRVDGRRRVRRQGSPRPRATRSPSSCRCPSATSTTSRDVPGVKAATWANWFGGKDPEQRGRVLRHHRGRPRDVLRRLRRDRASARADKARWLREPARRDRRRRRSRKQLGWKVGDKVTLEGTIYPGRLGVQHRRHLHGHAQVDRPLAASSSTGTT